MNYLYKIDTNLFPTKGIGYPKNFSAKHRLLTLGDVKYISSISPMNATEIIYEVIKNTCVFEGITIDQLYRADRDFLVFWLRSCSFIQNNGYVINIPKCPFCGQPVHKHFKLTELELDFAKTTEPKQFLNITVELPLINKPKHSEFTEEVNDILNYTNVLDVYGISPNDIETKFISILSASDLAKLMHTINIMKCGIRENIHVTCPNCRNDIMMKMNIHDAEMFGKFDLMNIIELVLSISKYANWQISDNTPYLEVEFMNKAVDNMIKQERENAEKATKSNA